MGRSGFTINSIPIPPAAPVLAAHRLSTVPSFNIPNKLVVNIHLLALDAVPVHLLLMHHNLLDQFIQNMRLQLCNVRVLSDERQKPFHIFIDLPSLRDSAERASRWAFKASCSHS